MTRFELLPLNEVSIDALWDLLRDERIAKHMPLHDASISREWVENWVTSKMSQWSLPAAGPWVILIDDIVVGWGGYQPDDDKVELALVLAPNAWGIGLNVVAEINRRWDGVGDLRPRVMYLPKSRRSQLIAQRFGLTVTDEVRFGSAAFDVISLDPQAQ